MIDTFFANLDDPKRPLIGPNYWLLKKMGMLLPKNIIARVGYIASHLSIVVFVLSEFVELYYVKSDLDLVLTNLKISVLSLACIVKANTFIFWQNKWKKVLDYVTEADKYERDNRDAARTKIIDSYTKYCRTFTFYYWILVFMTFITTTQAPLLKFLTSPDYRDELRNGTELFPHIFSSWMPLDKYKSPGCWITVVWHVFTCLYGACSMAAYDASIIVIMVFFGGKLDLLRERCKQMLGSSGTGISDEQAAQTIRDMHLTHVLLTKRSKLFNSLLSPVMFLYVVMCSLVLCSTAYQLTVESNVAQKLINAEYLVFCIAQLFSFCWHSNGVLLKSQNLMFGPYESEWWAASVKHRKSILLLTGEFGLIHIYKAGPFTDLTLYTFVTILKGAYSYYTLLRK